MAGEVVLVQVPEEHVFVIVALPTEFTLRMSLEALPTPPAKVSLIIRLAVYNLLGGKHLLVLNAEGAHDAVMRSGDMLFQGLEISIPCVATFAAGAPESLYIILVILSWKKHSRFMIKNIVGPCVFSPNRK